MSHHRLTRSAALGLALAALATPTAAAQQQDLRSPDARDAAGQIRYDLRTPDTRDVTQGRGTFSAPRVTVVKVAESSPRPSTDGIDWANAGIGAAGLLGVILLTLSTFAVVRRTRAHRQTATIS
jgi:hypothetical protein